MSERRSFRCAVYTRKSTEEGLDQDFNSLDAQREACEAYIRSQTHEGWALVRTRFDDGGYSGGSMERPGLQALLDAIRRRQIDVVVVYKIDRLTRSLTDFSRIVEVFENHGVSFVSVTQAFNTTTSMGRLTLNVLLSFAQFEREVTAERIRDKIAASKRKGMWMGGQPPLGYDVKNRGLVINEAEAETIRTLFQLYLESGSVRELQKRTAELGLVTKRRLSSSGAATGGVAFSRGHLYAILGNPIYVGLIAHRGETYPGQHKPIIEQGVRDAVQAKLVANGPGVNYSRSGAEPSLLTGLVFDEIGDRLSPAQAHKAGRRYRYYVSRRLARDPNVDGSGWRLPARELERTVVSALANYLKDHSKLTASFPVALRLGPDQLRRLLDRADAIADEIQTMAPTAVRQVLIRALERIDLAPGELRLRIRSKQLLAQLTHDSGNGATMSQDPTDEVTNSIAVPMLLRRRGVEAKLVIGSSEPANATKPDPRLIAMLAKAHRALALLTTREVRSVDAAANRLGIDSSDLTRIMPLAFLAPDVAAAILAGRQPIALTASRMRGLSPISADWVDQRQILGFSEPATNPSS
ncbi:MAG: recombinase family protein [Bauldia sp.]